MVRVEIIFDSRNIDEGFLEASLQFEKGIEKTVMWYLFSKIIPSLFTLKEGSTFFTKPLFNSLYAPSVPPVLGDRNPLGRENVTALRFSEPLRSKVGGVSKPCAMVLRDGTAWGKVGDRLGIALQ